MTAAVLIPTERDVNWTMVERAQQGDKDAFADIYRTYRPMIASWIYKRTSNKQVTEDLTADVFLRALCNIDRVEWRGKDIGAWLHTVARNRLADHYKSHAQSRTTTVVDDLFADVIDADPAGAPETAALDHLTRADLLDALKTLRPDQRQVIVLRFFNGMEPIEVAAVMGRTVGSIKMLQHRALVALGRNESVAALAGAA